MARFRSCLVSALVVIAIGSDECEVATLIQNQMLPTQSKISPVARDCVELAKNDCSFKVEAGQTLGCTFEHPSRLAHARWVRPGAKVLEVGARYGQATCAMSALLGITEADGTNKETGAKLVSADADPDIWEVLETNLAEHKCKAQIVKGTIGSKPYKLIRPENRHPELGNISGYGKFTVDVSDPRPGTIVPAHSVKSLNVTFDTLAIDCEGCFGHFFEERILRERPSVSQQSPGSREVWAEGVEGSVGLLSHSGAGYPPDRDRSSGYDRIACRYSHVAFWGGRCPGSIEQLHGGKGAMTRAERDPEEECRGYRLHRRYLQDTLQNRDSAAALTAEDLDFREALI
eukprot:s443_g21.t1